MIAARRIFLRVFSAPSVIDPNRWIKSRHWRVVYGEGLIALKITPIRAEAPTGSDELVCRVLLASLDALYATAYRLTAAVDVAEDLVQETVASTMLKGG